MTPANTSMLDQGRPGLEIPSVPGADSSGEASPWVHTRGIQYPCSVATCNRKFASLRGLHSHEGKKHPELYDTVRDEPLCYSKWSQDELYIMAKIQLELKAFERGFPRRIYHAMVAKGSTRTYEAVSRQLRTLRYCSVMAEVAAVQKAVERGVSNDQSGAASLNDFSILSKDGQDEPMECDILNDAFIGMDTDDMGDDCPEAPDPIPDKNEVLSFEMLLKLEMSETDGSWAKEGALDEVVKLCLKGEVFDEALNDFLLSLNIAVGKVKSRYSEPVPQGLSKAQERRWAKMDLKRKWKQNRSQCAKNIIQNHVKTGTDPASIEGFAEHWKATFAPPTGPIETSRMEQNRERYEIKFAITQGEIMNHLRSMSNNTASGPDQVSVEMLKSFPLRVVSKILNLIMVSGKVPPCIKKSRTVFIPKKDDCSSASDFRPISLTSVILRLFNKVIAGRVLNYAGFDYRQKAFLPIDGIAENIVLLEACIRDARKRIKNLYIITLDMRNAYGSVAHEALFKALECNGASQWLLDYVKDLYTDFSTDLCIGKDSARVQVQRGVLQGDPLSPVLFNMVIDQVLHAIPAPVGYRLAGKEVVNGMAFADDMNLLACSEMGAHVSLQKVVKRGRPWGLEFNSKKCKYVALRALRGRFVEVRKNANLCIDGVPIPSTEADEPWRYLGAYFTSKGLVDAPKDLHIWLDRIRNCTLKPQEKLYILRVHVLPKLIHKLCFSKVKISELERMDRMVRMALSGKQGILHLPRSTPRAFYHASVKDGGLGLLRFAFSVPGMIVRRFDRFENCHKIIKLAASMRANQQRIWKARALIPSHGKYVGDNPTSVSLINRSILVEHVDGRGLKHARDVSYAHQWVSNGSVAVLDGRQFCEALKLRSNGLPCRSRFSRGTNADRTCRGGCPRPETQYHIIQTCQRTHEARINRHNAVVKLVAKELRRLGYEVTVEPYIRTSIGVMRPDIVAKKDGVIYVIDPTITTNASNPDDAHRKKVAKYNNPELIWELTRMNDVGNFEFSFGSLAFTYTGLMSKLSNKYMRALGISRGVLKKCTLAVLQGSVKAFRMFKRSTAMNV
jgi:hypothetical protein